MKLQQTLRGALAGLTRANQSPTRLPDFSRLFQDDAIMPNGATVERRQVGELDLPSGRLVACDPAYGEEPPFVVPLSPGRYPVSLSIANLKADKRIAGVMVQMKAETAVNWKPALRQGDKSDNRAAYGVDSAIGCFMDEATAVIWRKQIEQSGFYETVVDQMDDGYGESCCWGNISLDTADGQVNAILFSTGYGDGFFRSYWGYSAEGDFACLVTDFNVLKLSVES
jgi:hypothetical protein